MVLEIAGSGLLGGMVRHLLERAHEPFVTARADDADLFGRALGCRAIVYAPHSSLLEGRLSPEPDVARMQCIVSASTAPGVGLIVAIVPLSGAFAEEELVLRKSGTPYVILRCAPLVDELAVAANFHVGGSIWLSDHGSAELATREALASALLAALLDGSLQGDAIDVRHESVEVAEALRRAASLAGGHVGVHRLPRPLGRAYRAVTGWLGVAPPPAAELVARLHA